MVLQKLEREVELLERHMVVLLAVKEHQPIGIDKLAKLLDLPRNNIRTSLHVLENNGFIVPTKPGAVLQSLGEAEVFALEEKIDEIISRIATIRDEKFHNVYESQRSIL